VDTAPDAGDLAGDRSLMGSSIGHVR